MSTDEEVTGDLLETLEDGKNGFALAGDKFDGTNPPEPATAFRRFGQHRGDFEDELQQVAKEYGDTVQESGSVAAALHRGWTILKDAISGCDPIGVLDFAEQGEGHAVQQCEDALESDVSAALRTLIDRQYSAVCAVHNEVRSLRDELQPAVS